jgi:hypothetical protein
MYLSLYLSNYLSIQINQFSIYICFYASNNNNVRFELRPAVELNEPRYLSNILIK